MVAVVLLQYCSGERYVAPGESSGYSWEHVTVPVSPGCHSNRGVRDKQVGFAV